MAKRIAAKIGEYQKDGQTKGKYVDIGVILSNENGEYILLDPTVNLAGVMIKQRLMNGNGKGESVMCGIYDNNQQAQGQQPQQQNQQQHGVFDAVFDDDIPF